MPKSIKKSFSSKRASLVIAVTVLLGMAVIGVIALRDDASSKKKQPVIYQFKELGISMTLSDGWSVTSDTSQQGDTIFYTWSVEKPGADGKIDLSSTGYRGLPQACRGMGTLTPITVTESASTMNDDLTYMAWNYKLDKTLSFTGIVKSNEAILRTTNDAAAMPLSNITLKPGGYFFCGSEPLPGTNLNLNRQSATGFFRRDQIKALHKSGASFEGLTSTSQSYYDIKAMLRSIK